MPEENEPNSVDEPNPEPKKPEQTPPAAKIVIEGERSEREAQLEKELEEERLARQEAEASRDKNRDTLKKREVRLSELEDENRSLKDALKPEPKPDPATPKPSPVEPGPSQSKRSEGWGFFDGKA